MSIAIQRKEQAWPSRPNLAALKLRLAGVRPEIEARAHFVHELHGDAS